MYQILVGKFKGEFTLGDIVPGNKLGGDPKEYVAKGWVKKVDDPAPTETKKRTRTKRSNSGS